MAPSSEVARYGNRTRHRIKSGGRSPRRPSPYGLKKYRATESDHWGGFVEYGGRPIPEDAQGDAQKTWDTIAKRHEEQEKDKRLGKEKAFDAEIRTRLEVMGYKGKAIGEIVGQEREKRHTISPRKPVYPRVHKDYLDVATLRYYDIPYEADRMDPTYIIILRELEKNETDILFEHTARLRAAKVAEEEREYDFYRRRSRSRSRRANVRPPRREQVDETSPIGRPDRRRSPSIERRGYGIRPDVEAVPAMAPTVEEVQEDDPFRDEMALNADEPLTLDFDLDLPDHKSDDGLSDVMPDLTSTSQGSIAGSQIGAPLDILDSKWLGSPLDTWELRAQLTTVSSPPAKNSRPTTKWYHMQRNMMNFEDFIATLTEAVRVTETDRMQLRSLLLQAQAEKEKSRQHGRQMEPVCVADSDYKEVNGQKKQTLSMTFFSFPILSLEKEAENGVRSLIGGAVEHPSRPIVASQNGTPQAVVTLSTTPDGHSWHTTDIWAILVNNDTLITCSKAGRETLRGDALGVVTPAHDSHERIIRVRAGEDRQWNIPSSGLRSGPGLASLFTEHISNFTGQTALASLKHNNKPIDNTRLKHMLDSNDFKADIDLTLDSTSAGQDAQAVKSSILELARELIAPTVKSSEDAKGQSVRSSKRPTLGLFRHGNRGSADALSNFADSLHRALAQNSQRNAKDAYLVCPERTREDVEDWLSRYEHSKSEDLEKKTEAILSAKERVAVLSQYLFAFFWPADFDHILTRKFWGALDQLLHGPEFYGQDIVKKPYFACMMAELYFETMYEQLAPLVESLATVLSDNEDSLRPLPKPFAKAWLFFMSASITAAGMKRGQNWKAPLQYFSLAAEQLREGERAITQNLRGDLILDDYEVCSTRSIAALLLSNVSRDLKRGTPLDIAATYDEYYQKLESKIESDPLNRSHQVAIRALRQELNAISKILEQQLEVVETFQRSLEEPNPDSSTQPLLPFLASPSRQSLVLKNLTAHLTSRIDAFRDLEYRRFELSQRNIDEIDTNKDRQEAAIMVFTIVTIIFLPLSFVASVLGMNTNDVRNMDLNQWVYWASAIPLTVLVVVVSLWWAGSFEGWKNNSRKQDIGVYDDRVYDRDDEASSIDRRTRRRTTMSTSSEKRPSRRRKGLGILRLK